MVEKQMPDDGGWIEWKGGECPVDPSTVVEVMLADGSNWFGSKPNISAAKYWDWDGEQHRPIKHIVAYRLARTQSLPNTHESGGR